MKKIKILKFKKLNENVSIDSALDSGGFELSNDFKNRSLRRRIKAIRFAEEAEETAAELRSQGRDEEAEVLEQDAKDLRDWADKVYDPDKEEEKVKNLAKKAREDADAAEEDADAAEENAKELEQTANKKQAEADQAEKEANEESNAEVKEEKTEKAKQAKEEVKKAKDIAEEAKKLAKDAREAAEAAEKAADNAEKEAEDNPSNDEQIKKDANEAAQAKEKAEKALAKSNELKEKSNSSKNENNNNNLEDDDKDNDDDDSDFDNLDDEDDVDYDEYDDDENEFDEDDEEYEDDDENEDSKSNNLDNKNDDDNHDNDTNAGSKNTTKNDNNNDANNSDSSSSTTSSSQQEIENPFDLDPKYAPNNNSSNTQASKSEETTKINGIKAIKAILKQLKGGEKDGAKAALTNILNKDNLTEEIISSKTIDLIDDDEFNAIIDKVLNDIEKVKKVRLAPAKDVTIKKINDFINNRKNKVEFNREDDINKHVEDEQQRLKNINSYNSSYGTRSSSEFQADLWKTINDQIDFIRQNQQTYAMPNRKFANTAILKKGNRTVQAEEKVKPSVRVYLDCSGSFTDSDIEKEENFMGIIKGFEEQGEIEKTVIKYFADGLWDDFITARRHSGDTNAWPEILQDIRKYKPANVLIVTDYDMQSLGGKYGKVSIPGVAWFIWKELKATNLVKDIDAENIIEYNLV